MQAPSRVYEGMVKAHADRFNDGIVPTDAEERVQFLEGILAAEFPDLAAYEAAGGSDRDWYFEERYLMFISLHEAAETLCGKKTRVN